MVNFELEKFSGPLDLLLQLIEQEKLDISQIALAKVTDQYLAYLDDSSDLPATELADFLVVATKLLVIKSKILLPKMADEEEDSAEQLEAQLKMYKEYLEASKKVEALIGLRHYAFTRERLPIDFRPKFSPPPNLKLSDLGAMFEDIIKKIDSDFDIVILNPPRKGLDNMVFHSISKIKPKKIIYVSCNPVTLARDLKIFKEKGFIFKKARSYDMFPQTSQVETVALVIRGQK